MPSYSSHQFCKDWIYAVAQNYHSPDGEQATWATGQPQHYGEEHAKINLPGPSEASSLNADEGLIAIGVGHDIHIYTTETQLLEKHQVLKGHVSRVDALSFHPTNPDILVSCAMNDSANDVSASATILMWDLEKQRQQDLLTKNQVADLGEQAAKTVTTSPAVASWTMTDEVVKALGQDFAKAIALRNIESQSRSNVSLHGRLADDFGSQVFSSDGRSMAFMPGERPHSNGDDKWDICIFDTLTYSTRLTLVGHRDAIMWIGFSPNDKFIASVAWDHTFRIWDHATGELIHIFHSKGQNWTGAFSKDSRFFAGTSGEGRVWVWDVVHGIEVVSFAFPRGGSWCRTLDWSPHGDELVVGGDKLGQLLVYNIKRQEVVQKRVLSVGKMPEDVQRMAARFLEVHEVMYLPRSRFGKKILSRTTGDNTMEIYDIDKNEIWRLGPGKGDKGGWCGRTFVLENKKLLVSVDEDAIRFWKLPDSNGN